MKTALSVQVASRVSVTAVSRATDTLIYHPKAMTSEAKSELEGFFQWCIDARGDGLHPDTKRATIEAAADFLLRASFYVLDAQRTLGQEVTTAEVRKLAAYHVNRERTSAHDEAANCLLSASHTTAAYHQQLARGEQINPSFLADDTTHPTQRALVRVMDEQVFALVAAAIDHMSDEDIQSACAMDERIPLLSGGY